MDEFEQWNNNSRENTYGLDNFDGYGDDSRGRKKKWWGIIAASLFLLVACALVFTIRSSRSSANPPTESNVTQIVVVHTAPPGPPPVGVDVGLTAPDFTLKTIDGDSITLSSLRGKTILLNFWATWCGYCREEMPAFQNVYEELKDDGFIIISITEEDGDELENVFTFRDSYNLTFPILLDEDGAVNSRYYVSGLPRTLLITPEGIIHKILLGGPITEDWVKQELSAMQP